MRRYRFALACGLGAMTLAARAAPARAQDVAAAEALFNRGLAEMQAGRYESGCPALSESYRLDPRPGTLFTVAECEARRGRVATAATRYGDYLALYARLTPDAQAKQKGRNKIATQRKAALTPDIPELTLSLPEGAPPGTVVKRDELELGAPMLGVPLPTDPGDHVVTTQAPGGPLTEARISIAKGEKKQITLEVKAAPPETPAAAAPPGAQPPPVTPPPPPATDTARRGSWQTTTAFVVGGVGIAGLALGGVMGGLALSKKATVDDNCDGTICNHEGKLAADSSRTFALVSTIGVGVGVVGVGAALVLLLAAPSPPASSASASLPRAAPAPRVSAGAWSTGDGGGMIGLQGAW
ncbi:tetratricopeptide repeat protein [Sorangium sp. So ce1153]|uniref:tetratricopeptide repeat protein n=1 Tax=Sorangium sp. So ce1153 TaxID=3133333 RepID=UPI003F623EBB